MNEPQVYVGLVAYNSLRDLPRCFAALRAQSYPRLHITAADNASQDSSLDWLRAQAGTDLIKNHRNVGYARAHNQIIHHIALGTDEFYLTLNPDVVLTDDYIERLVACLQHTGGGHASGKLLYLDGCTIYSAGHALLRGGYAFNIGQGMNDTGQYEELREVFGAPGAAALYSGRLIHALSIDGWFFDEQMFLYGEDVDVDWRARLQGWHCYSAADALAYHRGSIADDHLRIEALGNRYLSVLKNARLRDLLMWNLPVMLAHCILRLLFTPRRGRQLVCKLKLQGPKAWRARLKPAISRAEMNQWFAWSKRQPTLAPMTLWQRLRAFYR